MRSVPGAPYDRHILHETLERLEIRTKIRPNRDLMNHGYLGRCVQTKAVYITRQKRGVIEALLCDLRRRSVIEPMIGHIKTDSSLSHCALKSTLGDSLYSILCGCGHNIRTVLAHLVFNY